MICFLLNFFLLGVISTTVIDGKVLTPHDEGYDLSLPSSLVTHELNQHKFRHEHRSGYPRHNRQLETTTSNSQITPLYPGYGTHFSYIYVGTPPQRQSVIIDTGSHYTAFPCTGCQQCGQHTDTYWDLRNSSTATVPKCNGDKPCEFSQSYSEGSTWKAFKVVDKVFVGGVLPSIVPDANKYAIELTFGCQTFETGLFRTQLADGIMGMGQADDSIQSLLYNEKITTSKIFALCYRIGGGVLTLGGVDQRLHLRPQISYTALKTKQGWYSVVLESVSLNAKTRTNTPADNTVLKLPMDKFNAGKGTIIDSGTTDTYFPSTIKDIFTKEFERLSGVKFTSENIALTQDQLSKIPDIVFTFKRIREEDSTSTVGTFSVVMPMASYVDSVGAGKYAFRLYLTEGDGAVLGANFMLGSNVIFDTVGSRVGFAKSLCKYESFMPPQSHTPSFMPIYTPKTPTSSPVKNNNNDNKDKCAVTPITECNAYCNKGGGGPSEKQVVQYAASGTQDLIDCMDKVSSITCTVPCIGNKIVRWSPDCPEEAWKPCNTVCLQSRRTPLDKAYTSDNTCTYTTQTRTCYSGMCPLDQGDFLVLIDVRVSVDPEKWSYVYTEAFYGALAMVLNVRESVITLMNDIAGTEDYSLRSKLHFQVRIEKKDYSTVRSLNDAAMAVVENVWDENFAQDLVHALNTVSSKNDKLDHSRFGYLMPEDIQVLNAMALPISDVRDPIEIANEGGAVEVNFIHEGLRYKVDLILLGVAIAASISLCCVLHVNTRLQQERAALEKDKHVKGGSLYKFWNKITGGLKGRRDNFMYKQVELAERTGEGGVNDERQGLGQGFSETIYDDDDLANDDFNDNNNSNNKA